MRAQAGANLARLAALSARVDQLAGDQLAASLHSAEPGLKEGYAAALRGLLLSAGGRLSPPVVSKLGGLLAAMLPNAGAHCLFSGAAAATASSHRRLSAPDNVPLRVRRHASAGDAAACWLVPCAGTGVRDAWCGTRTEGRAWRCTLRLCCILSITSSGCPFTIAPLPGR